MSAGNRGMSLGRMASVLCIGLSIGTAGADVTFYDRAPSAEEVQQKLLGGDKPEQKIFKTRSIVFTTELEAQPTQQAKPQQEAQSAAVPMQLTAAVPMQQAPTPAPSGQSMQISDNAIAFPIQFKVNSAQLLPESLPFLQSIAGLMQKDPSIRLLVEGHTDISGNYQRNLTLSRERAFAVINHLVDHFGIDPMRLMPVGKGPMEPLPGHEPNDPKNRRVQFRIIG